MAITSTSAARRNRVSGNRALVADLQSNGYYNFVADNSGLCVDTPGASTASGVQLQQYTCNGTGAQEFTLVPA
jgi:hypothetical protein